MIGAIKGTELPTAAPEEQVQVNVNIAPGFAGQPYAARGGHEMLCASTGLGENDQLHADNRALCTNSTSPATGC